MDLLTTNQSETSADVELELEYEIEEDIEAELENLVRLNHTGQFEDAHELFDECLSSHDDWYPIAAEYADCLLREGKFKQLADFGRKASMTFQDPGEKMLLLLMGVIGNLAPRDTDVHILELVLLALVLTVSEPKDLEASLTLDSTSVGPWSVFKDLFYYLLHNQLLWEAQRILQSLLHTVSLPESQKMVHDYIEKAVSTSIGEESVQIAVSSLVQRFIYVTESRRSSPLAVVPWNDAITWALLGVTLAKKSEDPTSLFNCIFLRRSLQEELAPELSIVLPLDGVQDNDEISDSLYEAVINGDESMMMEAMIACPTYYTKNEVHSVALLKAAQRSSGKVPDFLNSKTLHARDGYQRTALHWAAINGDRQTSDILLIEGADPWSLDWFGCAPLHCAVKNHGFEGGDYQAVLSLLKFDPFPVIAKDLSGLGPLHTAILNKSPNMADLVLQHGATLVKSDHRALPPYSHSEYRLFQMAETRLDVRASTTSGLTSPKNPLASFQPSDLTLTGAKSGSPGKSGSGQFGPRTSRSHLLAGLRTAPKSPEPNTRARLLGQYTRQMYPPTNTLDQNPPCNTLYVGNLPVDTSNDELKDLFSKQRGYKRLYYRTKQNGPMCFVEFEDVSFATKALNELYGHSLHNSTKGGIRLSFSKNPLGVRTGNLGAVTVAQPLIPLEPRPYSVNFARPEMLAQLPAPSPFSLPFTRTDPSPGSSSQSALSKDITPQNTIPSK